MQKIKIEIKKILLFLLLSTHLLASANGKIETESSSGKMAGDSVNVVLGPGYKASKVFMLFMGEHWRDLWTTEIKVPVLDLKNFAGGLTPIKKGGSFQTKSLRLMGADGKQYKFRSIDKDPTQTLPVHLKQSVIADVLQDQTSISNPAAALIVPRMLDAVGVLNIHPKIYVMPDDTLLGEFRKDFGGIAGTIEENAKSKKKGKGGFGKYNKVITGFDIYSKTEKNNNERVDEIEFLKARLMDIFFGDRDRHGDQWKWAAYKKDGIRYWLPIPRDRDFAFCRYDGWLPELASRFEPSSIGFSEEFPPMKNQTYIGRHLDRRFLKSLTKTKWDSVVTFIKAKLTDDVIKKALLEMPEEFYRLKGEFMYDILTTRRDMLDEVADEFYELVYETADIYGTNEDEYFVVNRLNDEEVEVKIFSAEKEKSLVFARTYNCGVTNEIRIFMLDGKNKAVVKGNVDESILVRIIGGDDKDEMIDSSQVSGYFLDFTPIPHAELLTKFYDSGKKTKFVKGPGTSISKSKIDVPEDEIQKYEPNLEDRYGFFFIDPFVSYNTNDGVILGINPNYTKYGFRADPYLYSLSASALYATDLNDFDFLIEGKFTNVIKNSISTIKLKATGIEVIDYFGTGNETDFDEQLFNENYYRIEQTYLSLNVSQEFWPLKKLNVETGIGYEYSEIDKHDSTKTKKERRLFNLEKSPYGVGKNSYFSFESTLTLDTRDKISFPKNGIYLKGAAKHFPAVFNNKNDFTILEGDARAYFSTSLITETTLAIRAGGQKNFGKYPFFKSAFIGGTKNLRGFNRERFAGDASLFGQAELRIKLFNLDILLPGKFGITLLSESGKVFLNTESSTKWHSAYGAGVWTTILDDTMGLSFTIARSDETTNFYLLARAGF